MRNMKGIQLGQKETNGKEYWNMFKLNAHILYFDDSVDTVILTWTENNQQTEVGRTDYSEGSIRRGYSIYLVEKTCTKWHTYEPTPLCNLLDRKHPRSRGRMKQLFMRCNKREYPHLEGKCTRSSSRKRSV